jgi:hypothetical protein
MSSAEAFNVKAAAAKANIIVYYLDNNLIAECLGEVSTKDIPTIITLFGAGSTGSGDIDSLNSAENFEF